MNMGTGLSKVMSVQGEPCRVAAEIIRVSTQTAFNVISRQHMGSYILNQYFFKHC